MLSLDPRFSLGHHFVRLGRLLKFPELPVSRAASRYDASCADTFHQLLFIPGCEGLIHYPLNSHPGFPTLSTDTPRRIFNQKACFLVSQTSSTVSVLETVQDCMACRLQRSQSKFLFTTYVLASLKNLPVDCLSMIHPRSILRFFSWLPFVASCQSSEPKPWAAREFSNSFPKVLLRLRGEKLELFEKLSLGELLAFCFLGELVVVLQGLL